MNHKELEALMTTPLEHSVAELIAKRFETDLRHDDRIAKLGAAAAPVIREALPIAEMLRGTDIDPADAFLEGVSLSALYSQEISESHKFAEEMDAHLEIAAEKPRGRLRAWLLGSAALFFAGGKIIKPNWAEDDTHLAQ